MLVGTGFEVETDEISCDIVCKETDKVLTVYITNTEKSRNILEKILQIFTGKKRILHTICRIQQVKIKGRKAFQFFMLWGQHEGNLY